MAERNDANDQAAPPGGQGGSQDGQDAGQSAGQDADRDAAREGHSERAGEGGYGNDTGFATGTQASREDDGGGSVDAGTSAREEQTSNTYRDTGQGRGTP